MFRKQILLALLAGATIIAVPAYSQESKEHYRNEASVQAFGSFVKSTVDNGLEQKATNSGGVLATYRLLFHKNHGVEFNYGYARNTQSYGLSTGLLGFRTDTHESSAAYVFRAPLRRWTPFALAGVGGLVFQPVNTVQATTQARAAFIYGAGADFNLTRHLFMRAEYRGFVYNSPTYDTADLAGLERTTHRAQPSIGFGYRF